MKTICLFFLFILCIVRGTAQTNEFAPVGAKWWFNSVPNPETGDGVVTTFEVKTDTIIKGKNCRLILMQPFYDYLFYSDTLYAYEDSGKVFKYYPSLDTFLMIYNFNLLAEESYIVYGDFTADSLDSLKVIIDSIENIDVNGHLLVKQNISIQSSNGLIFGNEIIEHIGSKCFLIPYNDLSEIQFRNLRCYEDDSIGHYETGEAESCDVIIDIPTLTGKKEINIYPNPTSNNIYIEIANALPGSHYGLDFYDITGKLIFQKELSTVDINVFELGALSSGIYLIRINENGILRSAEKIIKE